MNFNIIVAYCKNNGIGINNKLPWKIKSDLKKFYKLTKGDGNNAIIMGKNTWLSLNNNPLKNRDNLIMSTTISIDKVFTNNNIVKTFDNIEDIITFCKNKNYNNVWIIGGENIYSQFMTNKINMINNIYVTYADYDYDCDTFFPIINNNYFRCILKSTHILDLSYNEFNDMIDYNVWDILYTKK